MGLAFGAGLLRNVGDAYGYLMNTYAQGDSVYLFGFSRGAYTARALAGVLHMYGLLHPGNRALIPYIIRMYAHQSRRAKGMKETLTVAEFFKATFSRDCPLHFVGLWDTVSSVGWIFNPVRLPFCSRNPGMRTGRHAVSIHERRCYFQQNLWGEPFDGQNIKQVWFTGTHSDIGAGYPEAESGLSKVTLEWMLQEAAAAGLRIDREKAAVALGKAPPPQPWMPRYVAPDPDAPIHRSLHGWYWLLELLPHRYVDLRGGAPLVRWHIPFGARRRIPDGSLIYAPARPRLDHWNESFQVEPAVTFDDEPANRVTAPALERRLPSPLAGRPRA
jgi:hypothetical protein